MDATAIYITMRFQITRIQEMILQPSREKHVFIQKINNQNGLGFAIATLKAQMEECFQSSQGKWFPTGILHPAQCQSNGRVENKQTKK